MTNDPLVSIVTPFHNAQPYLAECVDSVLRQTYSHWEYVLVDNRSTDGSTEIAMSYAALYPDKIRVVRTASFLSQVDNYNFALTCMSSGGKYCKMVQADDWLFPDCVRSMVHLAEAHPSVAIVGAYELEEDSVSLDGLPYPSPEVTGREACRRYFLKDQYLFGTPTSLLMRADLIRLRKPFYDERLAPFEDAHVCFDLLKAWNFGFVHQVLTYSRRTNVSVLSQIRSFGFQLFCYLAFLVKHGRAFLSTEEYHECLRKARQQYFLFLGKSALKRREPEFWQFHRKWLQSIDCRLDGKLLSKCTFLALLEYVGNPKRSWDALLSKRKRVTQSPLMGEKHSRAVTGYNS